jgi:hypothetical protein
MITSHYNVQDDSMRPPFDERLKRKQLVSPIERQTYTIEEAAKILGICRAVAYRKGVLPTVQIAGRRLVPKAALDRMLAKTA